MEAKEQPGPEGVDNNIDKNTISFDDERDSSVNDVNPTLSAKAKAPALAAKPSASKPHANKTFGAILGIILIIAAFTTGGIFAGRALFANQNDQDHDDKDNSSQTLTADGDVSKLAPAITAIPEDDQLTLAFLKLHNQPANSSYSPLSIRYALEMLSLGAKGETKAQIDALLGSHQASSYANITEHLALANSLWVQDGLENRFSETYVNNLQNRFGAELKSDLFQTATNINNWIENNTLGLLKDTLTDEDVKGFQAALINVLALDMDWQEQFDELDTKGQYFNFDEDKAENNPTYTTMHGFSSDSFYYSLADRATLFASDLKEYNGTQLQFVALMPDNLHDFIENLSVKELNQLLATLRYALPKNDTFDFSFDVYLPKFKIVGGVEDLISDLKALNITDVFDVEKADLSGMTDIEDFAIDAATHKTLFDLNEKGIKAAAVTITGGKGSSHGPGPIPNSVHIVVSIHKPFMYLVRDKANGEIWFAGTVYQPNLWADERADYGFTGEPVWNYNGES